VKLLGGGEAWMRGSVVEVDIINSTGMIIKTISYDVANSDIMIDLSDQPDGLYVLRIMSGDHSVQKKLSLFR